MLYGFYIDAYYIFCFFFSSRRRHTRWPRDWSSDVCSSDLGFSGEGELNVPSGVGELITDTILQTDDDDLNGNGVTDEPRLKSGNIYTMRGEYNLQTEKYVRGELDNEWSQFGQTVPEGSIDYRLKLTNTTGKDLTKMVLMDVLPSEGDLGITDNFDRGSQFTPTLTGPIVIPTAWENKVDVVYSSAKNPKRNDLTKNTIWPETTEQLTNPTGATDPNWMTASDVTDWSSIHSFKIELKDSVKWAADEAMTI